MANIFEKIIAAYRKPSPSRENARRAMYLSDLIIEVDVHGAI
jgi:hypothetical protein